MKKTNKGLVIIAILSILISTFSSGLIVPDLAYADSGTGGGSAGYGDTGYWRKVYGDPNKQEAWNTFYRITSGRFGANWLTREITNAGNRHGNSNLLNQCKASRYIWYYSNGNYPSHWYNQGSYTNNAPWVGGRPGGTDWSDFQKWGGSNWSKGNTVLVCSGTYEKPKPPAPKTRNRVETENRNVKNNETIVGTFAKESKINPVATQEYNTYTTAQRSAWQATHETQTSGPVLTEFGKWYKANGAKITKLNTLKGGEYTKLKKELSAGANAAKKKDLASPSVKMSAKNKKGFAKGGVFTMNEGNQDATISLTSNDAQSRKRNVTETQQSNGTWKVTKTGAWSAWSSNVTKDGNNTQATKSQVQVKFWQMLHAKCNDPGVKGVMSKVPNIKDDSASATVSDTLRSPVYTKQAQLPLGDPKNANKELKDTAYDPFYTQVAGCMVPIDCISAPLASSATSDAKNNVQDKGEKRNNTYGAQSKVVDGNTSKVISSDSFTYFRDNKENELRLDVWYPSVINPAAGVKMTAGPALKTRVMFDPKGTPANEMFNAKVGGKTLTGKDISDKKSLLLDGEVSKLNVSSSWASDNNKTQKANVDWVYNPKIQVELYDTLNGSGGVSNKVIVEADDLFLSCKMTLNKKDKNRPVGIDADTKDQIGSLKEFDSSAGRSLSTNFVRSGSGVNQR